MLYCWQSKEGKPENGRIIARLQQKNTILQPDKSKSGEKQTRWTIGKIAASSIYESKGSREKGKAEILQPQEVTKL